jgi:hypothetical protein
MSGSFIPIRPFSSLEICASAPNTMPQMRARCGNGTLRVTQRNGSRFDPNGLGSGSGWHLGWAGLARPKPLRPDLHGPGYSQAGDAQDHAAERFKNRFQLSVRNGNTDNLAYAITVEKKPQLKPSEGTEAMGVQVSTSSDSASRRCKILSSAPEASGYVFDYPLMDRTGLAGTWNFSVTWSPRRAYNWSPAPSEVVTLFDAFEKQLGRRRLS